MKYMKGDIVYDCGIDVMGEYDMQSKIEKDTAIIFEPDQKVGFGCRCLLDSLILLERPLHKLLGKEPVIYRRLSYFDLKHTYQFHIPGKENGYYISGPVRKSEFAARTAWNEFVEDLRQ